MSTSRREFLGWVGAGVAAALPRLARGAEKEAAPRPPNFVIIFCDDLGYADLGCYGAKQIKTPHLDRMAAEGLRLTDFYVAACVCTPSRAALLTGCYPLRVSLPHVVSPGSTVGLNAEEVTLAELLKARGYATACIGKWHLGFQQQFLPTRHGFDTYLGIPYSNDMSLGANMTFAPDAKLPPGVTAEQLKGGDKRNHLVPLLRDEQVIEYPVDQTTLTERYTEEAVKFITANKDKPFFLYLPHSMPHVPLHVSERFKGKSQGGLYGDVIECIDWGVGQVLDAIRKFGIDEQTLVLFTSDNGPWLVMKANGGSALPLREGKGTTWEGGMRVPCIVRWPGRVPAGKACSEMVLSLDVLPTFARLAGASVPTDRVIDGKDVWPLLSGQDGAKTPHEAFFYCRGERLEAVRSGPWKLHLARREGPPGTKPKAVDVPVQLYDLQADIGETRNVAAEHPDVVQRLTALAEQFRADLLTQKRPPGKA